MKPSSSSFTPQALKSRRSAPSRTPSRESDRPTIGTQLLVTRVPSALRRRVKIHCLERDSTMAAFLIEAVLERLAADRRRTR